MTSSQFKLKKTKKCIFLVVYQGFQARYLLRTDIFKELKKNFKKIVIITPNADEAYFKQEFQKDNVSIERFKREKCDEFLSASKVQKFFQLIRGFVLNGKYDLKTVEGHYQVFLKESSPKNILSRIKHIILRTVVKLLRASKILRKTLLWSEYKLFNPDIHKELFEKYKPDLVITTTLGNVGRGYDFLIMREAKKHGAKVVTIILSWDNTSGKGMGGAIPDHLIAWTKIMKKELIDYHDFPKNRISVGGISHFDSYYKKKEIFSKEEIFKKHHLDMNKKLIVFGTKSPTNYPWNAEIAQIIAEAIVEKKIPSPAQLLIRLHPLHFVLKRGKKVHIHFLKEYDKLVEKYSFVKIDKPKILSDNLTMDMPESEQIKLASTFKYTDVLVNMFSTLNIEAAIMDVPIVNIVFEGRAERKNSIRQNIEIDLDQVHNQRVVATGALKMCFTPEELIQSINEYLNDASLNRGQREVLAKKEAGPFKGTSGKKIAEIILNFSQNTAP